MDAPVPAARLRPLPEARRCPPGAASLHRIDFDRIVYYRKPSEREEKSWDDVPEKIKETFEKLGIPEAERKFLAGVGAQYDSEVVYHSVREELTKIGVVFMGTDQGLSEYPEIFRKYFGDRRPAGGQQVRGAQQRRLVGRLVRLRPQGRRGPAPAPGLLPDQRREHRPVRADADRRRRGRQGPLHRGLPAARPSSSASATRWCRSTTSRRGRGHEQRRGRGVGLGGPPPDVPGRHAQDRPRLGRQCLRADAGAPGLGAAARARARSANGHGRRRWTTAKIHTTEPEWIPAASSQRAT